MARSNFEQEVQYKGKQEPQCALILIARFRLRNPTEGEGKRDGKPIKSTESTCLYMPRVKPIKKKRENTDSPS